MITSSAASAFVNTLCQYLVSEQATCIDYAVICFSLTQQQKVTRAEWIVRELKQWYVNYCKRHFESRISVPIRTQIYQIYQMNLSRIY